VTTNLRARQMFGLRPADHGRPFQDLEVSYRPVELRSSIARALTEDRTVVVDDIVWQRPGRPEGHLAIEITTLDDGTDPGGVVLTVIDRTALWQLEQELNSANRELEEAYEELQSTNE